MSVKPKKKEDITEEVPIAPMIDMVFLLLVFFMCVSTVADSQKSKEVALAESDQALVPDDTSDRGVISVDAEGTPYIGDTELTLEQLKERIRTQVKRNPKLQLQVRADKDVEFGQIKKVLKACADAGVFDIIYSTYQMK